MRSPDSRPFVSSSIRWEGLVDWVILLGLSGSWIGLLGKYHWLADLGSHFRWQAAGLSLVALIWAMWRKRRVLRLGAVATLALNAGLLGATAAGRHPANAGSVSGTQAASDPGGADVNGFRLKVASLNVLTSNQDHARVLSWLQESGADLIFLMEVDDAWQNALRPLQPAYPHQLFEPRRDNFGLALLSRVPLESLRVLAGKGMIPPTDPSGALVMDSMEARLTVGGRALTVIGTHPLPPMGRKYAEARDRQLKALAEKTAASPRPVLLIGDLNASPWSHGMRLLTEGSPLRLHRSAWQPTWKARGVFAIPIDHALCTPPLLIRERSIGPEVGSDHRGQLVELGWAAE